MLQYMGVGVFDFITMLIHPYFNIGQGVYMSFFESVFSDFFNSTGVVDSIRVTIVMSFFSTTISSILGIFLGLFLERFSFKGKKIIIRFNRTLMGAPPVVIGLLAYMLLRSKGPLGFLGWVFTIKGMIFAQVIIITPIICGMVYSYAIRTAPAVRNFGKTMGASKRQINILIIKELRNEIYFSILTGFGRSISEVGAVFLIGGNIKNNTRTMTTAISTLKNAGEFKDGIYLGVILLVMAFIAQSVADYFIKEATYNENY